MSDEVDLASERAEVYLSNAIANARTVSGSPQLATDGRGRCHCLNCDEVVGNGLRFCDADCRDDWQLRENSIRRAGRGHASTALALG